MIFMPTAFETEADRIRCGMFGKADPKLLRKLFSLELLLKNEVQPQFIGEKYFRRLFTAAAVTVGESGYDISYRLSGKFTLFADPKVLEWGVLNLLSNACLYSQNKRAHALVWENGGRVVICIFNRCVAPLIPPAGISQGISAARRSAQLCGGSLTHLHSGHTVAAVLSLPVFPITMPETMRCPFFAEQMVNDSFSAVRVGLSSLKKC